MKHLTTGEVDSLRKQALRQAEVAVYQARLNLAQAEAALRAIEADLAPGVPARVAGRIANGHPSEAD